VNNRPGKPALDGEPAPGDDSFGMMKHWFLLAMAIVPLAVPASSSADLFSIFRREPRTIEVRPEEARKIGQRIWQNECGGTIEGLTSWNRGEDFASLGIGHFIWYPAGMEGPFEESWPKLMDYMRKQRLRVPAWVAATEDCPWRTYESFHAARESAEMRQLRQFLANTVEVQTGFIVERLQAALPKMTNGATSSRRERDRLKERFYAVASTGQGVYALIDYVNFKGEGVKPEERYRGQGWGLAQVLLEMRGKPRGAAAAIEFSEAAQRVLQRRIANAPRDERRWYRGWMKRCETYKQPL